MTIRSRLLTTLAAFAALTLTGMAVPAPAAAHCDSMSGPVVQAGMRALERGQVIGVLVWVRKEDEREIRDAFERTLQARRAGGEAREVADRWFFETLVRVHRAGEGEPYTGLKPAGYEAPEGIEAADQAIQSGRGAELAARIAEHAAESLRAKYERVMALKDYDPADVEAGRAYVHAYVEYIHFVEQLHGLIEGGPAHGEHEATAAAHGH